MEPLLPPEPGSASAGDSSLTHVIALSTRASHFWWWVASFSSALGLATTELHSWTLLMTRPVTGCSLSAHVPSNSTLSSCATLGFFETGGGLATVSTSPSPSWCLSLSVALAAVVFQWVWAVDVITGQTWRAGALLPHGIFLRTSKFNGWFYTLALIFTGTYIVLKFVAFGTQPSTVTVSRSGSQITVALASVFSTNVGAIGDGGLITLAASIATLWFSFAGVNSLVARHANDTYADTTVSMLIECTAAGKGPCELHDARAPGVPTPVLQALAKPMLHLDAEEVDKRLRDWFDKRGLKARFPWRDARWLRRCPPDVTADAAAWIKGGAAASVNAAVEVDGDR